MTVVDFDVKHPDFDNIMRFLIQVKYWQANRDFSGRITGIRFQDREDAIAFKLKFGL